MSEASDAKRTRGALVGPQHSEGIGHVLVVRLDSLGDVLLCGPAVRAVAEHADRVTMLVSSRGASAAALLPDVDSVLVWDCPWITSPSPPLERADVEELIGTVERAGADEALILTSLHQSALPTALVLRMAGVPSVAAVSTDYPGELLTRRLAEPPDGPEALRMLAIAEAAGYRASAPDRAALRLRDTASADVVDGPYVVVHPGADAPARAYPESCWREVVGRLTAAGRTVVVTGSPAEARLARSVAVGARTPGRVLDLAGRTDLPRLAGVLRDAEVVVVANTGPAHLAASVGTPVVSLFAPVVPAVRWAPYGVPLIVLGDQDAACRDTRARDCPVPGHPCLSAVPPEAVEAAVDELASSMLVGRPG